MVESEGTAGDQVVGVLIQIKVKNSKRTMTHKNLEYILLISRGEEVDGSKQKVIRACIY